jgi:hypothetical protein
MVTSMSNCGGGCNKNIKSPQVRGTNSTGMACLLSGAALACCVVLCGLLRVMLRIMPLLLQSVATTCPTLLALFQKLSTA